MDSENQVEESYEEDVVDSGETPDEREPNPWEEDDDEGVDESEDGESEVVEEEPAQSVFQEDVELAQKRIESALAEIHGLLGNDNKAVQQPVAQQPARQEQIDELSVDDKVRMLEAELMSLRRAAAQEAKVNKVYNTLQQFMDNSIVATRAKYSDYDAAAEFYLNARKEQFKALSGAYPDSHTDEGAMKYVHEEMGKIIAQCAKEKTNPAERIYNIARKLGYTGKKEAVMESRENVEKKIKKVNFAKKATKTLTTSIGGTQGDFDIPEDEEEFDDWIRDPNNKRKYDRMFAKANGYASGY